jgi:hypothetical protein
MWLISVFARVDEELQPKLLLLEKPCRCAQYPIRGEAPDCSAGLEAFADYFFFRQKCGKNAVLVGPVGFEPTTNRLPHNYKIL